MKIKDSFHLYAGIAIVFWSWAYVLTRITLQHFSAFSLGFLRYFIASGVLIAVMAAVKMKLPVKTDIKWFIASGVAGFSFYIIVFNKGCETVTAATSSVIIATVPVITALLARLVYKEKLSFIQQIAIVIQFTGVIVLTLLDGFFTANTGLFWLFLAAMALSVYNLLQRKLTKTYSALQACAFSIFAGTIMLAVFLPDALQEAKTAPQAQLIYVVVLGVFSSAIAYLAWAKAFAKATKTSSVSNYMFVTPLLTSILGFLTINETPDFPTIIGGAIIMSGLLAFNFGEKIYDNLAYRIKNYNS